jgi:hypothetical protein
MNTEAIAIFTDNIENNVDTINKLKVFLLDSCYKDFFIFTTSVGYVTSEHSVLTPYYLIAYKGLVVFLDIEDYLEYKDSLSGKCAIFIPQYDSTVDTNLIKNCNIITYQNSQLTWIKKHEL